MSEETRSIYFIEETQSIEGAYVEVQTLYVADNEEDAKKAYEDMLKQSKRKSFGLLLNEYVIKADQSYFMQLMRAWKKLPSDFYRKMQVLTYRPLAEYQG